MAVAVYNYAGAKQTTSVSLPKVKPLNEAVLSDVLRSVQGNAARGRALAKTRGNVAGGGAKPWRQKGTGRARAGSNRSPIWRGGGVTFGPTGQSRAYRHVPAKVRKAALLTLLTRRAEAGDVIVLSGKPAIEQTKQAKALFSKLPEVSKAIFVVGLDQYDATAGSRNLKDVELTTVADLNAVDVARAGKLIASQEAWDALTSNAPAPKKDPKETMAKPRAGVTKTTAKKVVPKKRPAAKKKAS